MGKESTCNAGDTGDVGSIPELRRLPGEGNGNCSGQRSLVGYSPWGHKELEKTERLNHLAGHVCPMQCEA